MSLRTSILTHALPLISTHSFTRAALSASLTRLPSDHPDARSTPVNEAALDTLYGEGNGAALALVQRWAEEGSKTMMSPSDGSSLAEGSASASSAKGKGREQRLGDMLARRIDYSAEVGEHLVEVSEENMGKSDRDRT